MISRFYGKAAAVIDSSGGGIVDKFVGDEVVALFIPGFAGTNHAEKAIAAARRLVSETEADSQSAPESTLVSPTWGRLARVMSATSRRLETPRTRRRGLPASAGIGEILVSSAAAGSAGLDTADLETRRSTSGGGTPSSKPSCCGPS